MSRDDGFAVMDVSTSIHEDHKFKRLARRHPELIAPAFLAYVATVAESWRAGERVPLEDAWPALLAYDRAVVTALRRFQLVDREGRVACDTWERWFLPAQERKQRARERWARGNAKRHAALMQDDAETAQLPRGSDAVSKATGRSVRPTDPSVLEITPPPAEQGKRRNGTNPRALGTNPRAKGTSPRQEREAEKRAGMPLSVHEILQRVATGKGQG